MNGEMTEREIEQLRDLCRRAWPYMVRVNNDATLHYLDRRVGEQRQIMQETRAWLEQWQEMQK